ncbi:MAG: hypothetical protein GXP05_10925 [Alphaproteobacteria bacterium]|nr:hypothetical protein [Alphaproteobacteria bacterium]
MPSPMGGEALAARGKELGVTLHLGAHKTATSHFRKLLLKNAPLLEAHQLALPDALTIRREITKQLPMLAPDQTLNAEQNGIAHRLAAGRARVHILDENISPARIFQERRMYPRAAMRVGRALHLLPDCQMRLFLAIRNPVSFVVSAYLETVRNTGFLSFETYLDQTPLAEIRWARMVNEIRAVAGDVPIFVWQYEDYLELIPQLVALTLGLEQHARPELLALDEVVRPGMSAKALSEMERQNVQKIKRSDGRKIQAIMDRFPRSPDSAGPQVLTLEQISILDKNYRQDIETIGNISGVTLITP